MRFIHNDNNEAPTDDQRRLPRDSGEVVGDWLSGLPPPMEETPLPALQPVGYHGARDMHAWMPGQDDHEDLISASHARSARAGLSIHDTPDFSGTSAPLVRRALEENQFLYEHAAPVMETLYEQIVNTHSMVLLTGADGLIVHSLGDDDFLEKATQVALMPGVNWSEQSKGTNAVGTALTERHPVVVHGRDHYLTANHFLTCSCAPIFDPYGKVVGALDVTGDQRSYHHHTLALVRMSAQMIENHMFANVFADAVRIHFHSRSEFLGTLVEGIAVFSMDGRFLSANRSAQFQLGHPISALQAHTFSSLFGQSMSQFVDRVRAAHGQPVMLCLHNGVSVWCQARMKLAMPWMSAAPAPTASPEAPQATAAAACKPNGASGGSADKAGLSGLHFLDTGDAQVAAVINKVRMVRGRDIPIMILGETGTGKDILAQAIHMDSDRAQRPFVSVNCASIPESLIESELFGYEEGAFTGAKRKGAPGRILQANGGTLFLDEIGDMPTQLQARLLRVLQERRVNPLGSTREYDVDVAIVCATNRPLRELIASGQFRQDLYYRLNGLVVKLPPLRERSDFAMVTRRILQSLCEKGSHITVSPQVMDMFARFSWPGNIRQLHNLLRTSAAMLGCEGEIGVEHLPDDFLDELHGEPLSTPAAMGMVGVTSPPAAPPHWSPTPLRTTTDFAPNPDPGQTHPTHPPMAHAGRGTLGDVALQAMADALRQCHGNVSAAAKMLGVSRNTIYRKKALLPPDLLH